MTMLGAGLAGYAVASGLTLLRLNAPPEALMRTNVSGLRVPAVLGGPVAFAALTVLASLAGVGLLGWDPARYGEVGGASALVIAVMAIAGGVDDRRGEEADRGFKGHLGALRRGRVTGGLWKIAAGAAAGGLAGLLLFPRRPADVLATLLLVALSANAVNLFDRAPGRAGKVVLLLATPLMALGDVGWAIAAAGAVGALVAVLPFDLGERAMLGDAGANPLGGLLGVGLAVSLGDSGRWIAIALLLALNLASERWSFSTTIASSRWLAKIDRMGRK
jgi:UDP-GlcNAc:undecaprenyl-phosphate/decaprenyl-phosphate GlcNAc-1-phosphate transferase